eukprot:COSAG01_NODE_340_length_18638_cov_56.516505_2_plen_112_part_00
MTQIFACLHHSLPAVLTLERINICGRGLAALRTAPHAAAGRRGGGGRKLRPELDVRFASGWTALSHAVSGGHDAAALLLLRSGASVGAQMADGRSALLVVSVSISRLSKRR